MERYGSLTVKDLRSELKSRNARLSGTKEVLIQRLEDYDRNEDFIPLNIVSTDDIQTTRLEWPPEKNFKSVSQSSVEPPIDIGYIIESFLDVYKNSKSSCAEVHRKGFSMMNDNFLCALIEAANENHLFYIGQVNSEMTKQLTYFSKLALNMNGSIAECHCECIAGKGPKAACKHIAAICYALLRFKENRSWQIRKSCTEKKQTWHMPKKSRIESSPKKTDNISLSVPVYNANKRETNSLCYDPRPSSFRNSASFNDDVRNKLINFSSARRRSFGLSGVFGAASIIGIINDHDYLMLSPLQTIIYNRIKVTRGEANDIEKSTRQQSSSDSWHKERCWRITASNVGAIVHMTERRNKEKFAENLVSPKPIYSLAIKWGKRNEENGLSTYKTVTGNNVIKCGLFVSTEYPFLAGTPDGLAGGNSVLEVKCPYSIRNQEINADSLDYLEITDGKLQLKKTNNYYYQVQTQMFVSGRQMCDFIVWTNCDCKILPVLRNHKARNYS